MNVYDSMTLTDVQDMADLPGGPGGQEPYLMPGPPWLILGGTIAVLAALSSKGKPKVSGPGGEYAQYILPVGLVIGGYLVLKNFGLLGNNATSQDNAKTTAQVQATTQSSIDQATAAGGFATLSDAQVQGLADDIYTKGIDSTLDQDGIVNDVIQVNTTVDLLKLIQAFGTRNMSTGGVLCSLFRVNCTAVDLPSFIKGLLDAAHVQKINGFLSAQQINYQF